MSYQTHRRNKNRGYMNLIVWQKAMDLFELAWEIAYKEAQLDFKLRSQFVDAVQSISSNISEGYGRRSVNEYIQYLYIALGSSAESLTRAFGLNKVEKLSDSRIRDFDLLHYEVENRLLKLIEKLEQKRDDGDWIARISEDPEEYRINPSLHDSSTPSLPPSSTPSLHNSSTPSLPLPLQSWPL
jgi:four helix bundle protein